MQISTSQLLFARWYAGSGVSVVEARAELRRRGWSRPRQLAVLSVVLPCISLDRLMRRLDVTRDDSDESGTLKELLFSALFSAFIVALTGSLAAGYGIVRAHDSGRSFSLGTLLTWLGVAVVSWSASRFVSRREA